MNSLLSEPDSAPANMSPLPESEMIDLRNDQQITALSKSLRLGPDVLREAVKAFGPSVKAILALTLLPR
jgi:hypothetical protein